MEVGIQCRGCGVGLLPGIRLGKGLGGGKEAAPASRSFAKILSFEIPPVSGYGGLRAEPATSSTASISRFSRVEEFRSRRSRKVASGRLLHHSPWTTYARASGAVVRRLTGWTLLNSRAEGGIKLPNLPSPSWFWEGVKKPLIQSIQDRGLFVSKQQPVTAEAEAETRIYFSEDWTVNPQFPNGELSTAAIDCIEQFGRLNGLSGKKMRSTFESSSSPSIQDDPRNLVEFTCFRYLGRCNSDLHPSLKDAAFRRLTFSAMLAWQRPYKDDLAQNGTAVSHDPGLPRIGLVGEEAFARIAPAIPGAADRPTAHGLYDALVGENEGLSFETWDHYCSTLCKVQKLLEQQQHEAARLGLEDGECVLAVGSDTTQPVQKWSKATAWPGRLTLTDRALYFEANGLTHYQKPTRLDISGPDASVEQKKVGPFGLEVFESAISVSSSPVSEPWILQLVDFSGEGRRNIWLASIKEILSVHAFIAEYGVKPDDPLVDYVYGAKHGRKKALSAAMVGVARLQAVQEVLGTFPSHPERLLQFSHCANAPSGELVLQALAVEFWGGRMELNTRDIALLAVGGGDLASDDGGLGSNIAGTDGTVYLRSWATSPSWTTGKSNAFWKGRPAYKGLVMGKNHVVGGLTQVERAVQVCGDQTKQAERTQATIEGALVQGIPSNVDLLKELLLPFSIAAVNLDKLRRWENIGATVTFLFFVYGIIYMNWLKYVIPSLLLTGASGILTLRFLKSRGHLGDDFGKVTIREQSPTNTIQQILSLKEALSNLEDFLQANNIALLKLRTVVLSREPRVTNEILMALTALGVAMLLVPFRYLVAAFILEQFTNTLHFREKSVREFFSYLGDWWNSIPAAPVVVLPPEKQDEAYPKLDVPTPTKGEALVEAMREWLGEDNDFNPTAIR